MTPEEMTPEEKIELAELLQEEMFRSEYGIKTELAKQRIGGVDRTVLLVKMKLRPAWDTAEL
jgi:hypothetical protein